MMYRISALAATSSIHPALYAISVRTVGISLRTSSSTVCYLPAVVLQVWDSASSRLRADFHRSAHIASVVQHQAPHLNRRGAFSSRVDEGDLPAPLAPLTRGTHREVSLWLGGRSLAYSRPALSNLRIVVGERFRATPVNKYPAPLRGAGYLFRVVNGSRKFSFLVKHLQTTHKKNKVTNERQNFAFCFGN